MKWFQQIRHTEGAMKEKPCSRPKTSGIQNDSFKVWTKPEQSLDSDCGLLGYDIV